MGILRTLAIIVLAYFGVRAIRKLLALRAPQRDPMKTARTIEGADMVKDPACGIYSPRDSAVKAKIGGETFHFCSERCREAYEKGERAEK